MEAQEWGWGAQSGLSSLGQSEHAHRHPIPPPVTDMHSHQDWWVPSQPGGDLDGVVLGWGWSPARWLGLWHTPDLLQGA